MFQFISRLIDDEDPIIITPFGGYANDNHVFAQARVLEDEGIVHTEEDDFVKNLFNSYKRFETDEIKNVEVIVEGSNFKESLISDREGYVYLATKYQNDTDPDDGTLWLPIRYQLKENQKTIYSIDDKVMRPSKTAGYGVITDMDDTVIETGLSSVLKWKVIVNSFFKHSNRRVPLEGAQEFYQMLHDGMSGADENPFFYLSNSPWNLYEYLTDFLDHYHFPKGVLLLRDIGFENKKKERFQERNKYVKISHILSTYPTMKFVLIGDAVDIDHDIYIEIARKFPNRILTIYIRTTSDKKKMEQVKQLIESTTEVDVLLIEDTDKAIAHAQKNQLILSR